MRRILFWFLSTVTVLVLLFGYHTSTEGTQATAGVPAVVSSTPTATPGSTASSGSTSTKRAAKRATTSPNPPASTASTASTATGAVADTQWGPVQVKLTVKARSITDVSVLQYPSGNGTDAQINSYALPVLIRETIAAQSAQIDMVSGATVTSTGYLQSLQSALDQAGL